MAKRIIPLAIVVGFLAAVFWPVLFPTGDVPGQFQMNLTSDKPRYMAGDHILLTLNITAKTDTTLHLYEQMENTIRLMPLTNSLMRKAPTNQWGAIKSFEVRPDSPVSLQMEGRVRASNTTNKLVVDFDRFGSLEVTSGTPIEFYADVYPVRVVLLSSESYIFGNNLTLFFSERQE